MPKVFLSSTSVDLRDYREAVATAIRRIDGYECIQMEDFGARAWEADDFCRARVAECDVYVGLVGLFYGTTPPGQGTSYTEREYEAAKEAQRPSLLYVTAAGFPVDSDRIMEEAERLHLQKRFRERVMREQAVDRFGPSADALAGKVAIALQNLAGEQAKSGHSTAQAPAANTDLAAIERTYLAFLANRYQYLDFKGMGVSGLSIRFPLLDLYVPLKARPALPEGEKGGGGELRLAGRRMTKEEREEAGSVGRPVPVLELLQKESGLVLLGDPGAGKSTFLKALAVSLATDGKEASGLVGRVPFLVPIAGYAEALSKGSARLDQFIASDFKERVGDLAVGGLLESVLATGRALLLLDGLDEVRERSLQQKVVARVQDFFSLHSQRGNKFVVTSRLVGYREVRPTAKGLVEATLLDFDDEEIEAFLARWVVMQEQTVFGDTRAATGSAERQKRELSEALQRNQAVRSLAANPLLLTILALMKRQGVTLPEQRAKLYDNYIRTLLESWSIVRSLRGVPVVERSAADLLKVLAPLALWIRESSPGVGLVRRNDLLTRLESIYREERGLTDPEGARLAAEAFLRDVNESCLLLERGNGLYGFLHLTFLEYLAGYALAKLDQKGTEALLEAIVPRVGEPTWREVLLLAIGHLGAVEEREVSAGAVLSALVDRKPGPPGEAEALAGQALADLGPGGVHLDVRKQVLDSLLGALRDDAWVPARQRAAVGEALAVAGDPRPEVMTLAGMEFCWVPPGPFVMGRSETNQITSDAGPQHKVEVAYGYWIGRYPVTNAQFLEYVRVVGEQVHVPERFGDVQMNAPVVGIDWLEAMFFCDWLNKNKHTVPGPPVGWNFTLPSELEWEKAARGGQCLFSKEVSLLEDLRGEGRSFAEGLNPFVDRAYPWGPQPNPNLANYFDGAIGMLCSVGCFPGGESPCGCEDLCGNIWEWTRSQAGRYPYDSRDGREDVEATIRSPAVILRGGSGFDSWGNLDCATRVEEIPDEHSHDTGFRVVMRPGSL